MMVVADHKYWSLFTEKLHFPAGMCSHDCFITHCSASFALEHCAGTDTGTLDNQVLSTFCPTIPLVNTSHDKTSLQLHIFTIMKETLETAPKGSIVVSIHGHGSACRSVHGEGTVSSLKIRLVTQLDVPA